MAILTFILLVSTAFALGDAMIRPKTPCEDARDAALNGSIGAYVPTCDDNGQYTPEQCWGSTGHCWCLNSSGQKIPGTETTPGTPRINCTNQNGMIRPKTLCEIARDTAMEKVGLGVYVPTCDNDGQYTPEQCWASTGYCWCVNSTGQKIPSTETPPDTARINCCTQNGILRPKTPCEVARDTAMEKVGLGVNVPTCDNDGQYTPEQCWASTGYCWCVNSSGQKIPGTETKPGTARINCATQNGIIRPKTPCEIARDTAMKKVGLGVYVPTCDNDGQYTHEQCWASTGYCWCVNSSGQKIPGTETPPGTARINCCTQNGIIRPKTPCEIAKDTAMKKVGLGVYVPTCDNDGQYTPEQCWASTGCCWCVNSSGQKIPGTETPPGTARINCCTQNGIIRPKTPCEIAKDTAMKKVGLGVYVPTCDNDGQYTPEQCWASTGYCWCVNSSGQKIPGTETPPGTARINCCTQNGIIRPKTPCEIARVTAMKKVGLGVYVPTCDNDGQYTPEQCWASTGYCWCVNSSGQKILGTETLPGTARINCCTQNGIIRPKTPCEIAKDTAMKKVGLGVYVPTCDNDGQYTPEQCWASTGYCWCVNSSGQKIPGTETPPDTARINYCTQNGIIRPKTPCEIARDTAMEKVGLGVYVPTCDNDGQYTPEQCWASTGYCWCVNSSGQKIPGTETPPGTARINCCTQNGIIRPKTPCEIAKDTAMKKVGLGVYVPTCDNDGQYTPEQCWASTGYCWCVNSSGQKIPGTETPPGTARINCCTQNGIIRPKTPCEIAKDTAMKKVGLGVYVPTCDNDGQYTPEQCWASTGYCWCVNSSGQKIPGTETPPGTARINCCTQNGIIRPKTPCEIAKDTAMKKVGLGVYVPTCDNDGQYTPEQCWASTGYCWCVNSSGQKIPGTETPPGTARINCCTQNATIRPKTPCERARDDVINGLIGAFIPTCDAAGQYTPEQCSGSTGYCWCVNSSGRKIPGTETPPDTARINCTTLSK